jgi:hypothetical protein
MMFELWSHLGDQPTPAGWARASLELTARRLRDVNDPSVRATTESQLHAIAAKRGVSISPEHK